MTETIMNHRKRLTCLHDVFNSGDEVDDRDDSDDRKSSDPSAKNQRTCNYIEFLIQVTL